MSGVSLATKIVVSGRFLLERDRCNKVVVLRIVNETCGRVPKLSRCKFSPIG